MCKTYPIVLLLIVLTIYELKGQNVFPATGNVGVGISSPVYPLHVRNTAATHRARFHFGVGIIDLVTYTTGALAYSNSSGMFVSNQDALLMAGNSKDIRFVTYTGQYTERMRIKANGNVGIGTLAPTHKLEVNGNIRAKEIKLEATNWPDYVFEEGYELMPLEKVKEFIDANGHLPGLKSALDYEADGVNMMELNQKLLEKIEELTLHLIHQKELLENQDIRLSNLEKNAIKLTPPIEKN